MSPEVAAYFAGGGLEAIKGGVFGSLSVAAAAASAAALVPQVAKRVLPQPKETRLSDFITFRRIHKDQKTVVHQDGRLTRVFSITGVDQGFLNAVDEAETFLKRKDLVDGLADSETKASIRVFTMRERVRYQVPVEQRTEVGRAIATKWNSQFDVSYVTRTYMAISVPGDGADLTKIDEVTSEVDSVLEPYLPVLLTQNPEDAPDKETTLAGFLGRLIAPVSRPSPGGFGGYLAEALAVDAIEFHRDGMIVFENFGEKKFATVMGIRRLATELTSAFTNEINSLPCEATVLQVIEPQPKLWAISELMQNQKIAAMTSFSPDVWTQFQSAIEMVEGSDESKASIAYFTEVIFLFGESRAEVKASEAVVRKIVRAHRMTCTRERGASQASWFMQFPGYPVMPRQYRLVSPLVALLATFDRPATGLESSDWGPGPIAMFRTTSNTVYSHQFHNSHRKGALAHGAAIAPSEAGKSTLFSFLSLLSSRHQDLQQFMFDRFQGLYVYTTAMEGEYLGFNSRPLTLSKPGGMNPFQCDKTDEETKFLTTWLHGLAGGGDAASFEDIGHLVDLAFEVPLERRTFATVFDSALTEGSAVKEALKRFVDPKLDGKMFNAAKDSINLEGNWLTSFDMTTLMNDEMLAGAAISYIMHRIRKTLEKRKAPGFCFIDETEPLLKNDAFKSIYFAMLQEFRKLRTSVISVFQRPGAITDRGISQLLRGQCSAFYFFPNGSAKEEDYKDFDLTPREMEFVLGKGRMQRRVERGLLIKKPLSKESVIVDVNLSSLGPHLKVFNSSTDNVALVSELQASFPAKWLTTYIERDAA